MPWLFGYGSIMSPHSAELTLRAPLHPRDLRIAVLRQHVRHWRLVAPIEFTNGSSPQPANAVFLDIGESPVHDCIGVMLRVSEEQAERFDERESEYDRVDVTHQLDVKVGEPVFMYRARAEHTRIPADAVIPSVYLAVLQEAFAVWGEPFRQAYIRSTLASTLPTRDGGYRFVTDVKNAAAGR